MAHSSTRHSLESKINKTTDTSRQVQNDKQKSQLSISEIKRGAYTCPFSRQPHFDASKMMNAEVNATIIMLSNMLAPSLNKS